MTSLIENNDEKWIKSDVYLGRGAFCTVELWKNIKNDDKVAIKRCQKNLQELSERQKERWIQEVQIMKYLDHPNIVKTCQIPQLIVNEKIELPVLCMEYCKKGDLRKMLRKDQYYCGVDEELSLKIMFEVSSAVEYLHGLKITHRDLKPENIVIQEVPGGKLIFKLIDLGYAKEIDESSIDGSIVGTLNYIAPELILDNKYNCTVDYWSIGILFYELLTGVRPFLPNMPFNPTWLNSIKQKADDDIAAREIDKKINFFKTIEDPSNISECLKKSMVPWFRIVFQWDPKKRGKYIDDKSDNFVVFPMLKEIINKKILYVFYVTFYKNDSFEIPYDANLLYVKNIIFKREKINIDEQIITTPSGVILQDNNFLITKETEDSNIIVFEKGLLNIKKIPEPVIPNSVHLMLAKSRVSVDYFTLIKYYNDSIFFINQEIELYRSYLLSLCTKIDLCDKKFEILQSKIEKMLSEVMNFETEVKLIIKNQENGILNIIDQPDIDDKLKKYQTLINGSENLKKKLNDLGNNKEELRNKLLDEITIEEISVDYEKALDLKKSSMSLDLHKEYQPIKMVKLVFDFWKKRTTILQDDKLVVPCRQIFEFEEMLTKLEKSLTSFNELLPLYQDEINKLLKINQENLPSTSTNNSMAEENPRNFMELDDSIIYDNIMLGHMIDSLMDGINKIKNEAESMDVDT